MSDKAYSYMNWRGIDDIVCGECRHPKEVLAPRLVKEGTLFQCYCPGAKEAVLVNDRSSRSWNMTCMNDNGWFAVVVPLKRPFPHSFLIDGTKTGDPYAFDNQITLEEETQFISGIYYRAYKKIGSRPMELNGEQGVLFSVWAPNAARCSVVGSFNSWNGVRYPMEFHEDSGLYELFIPGLEAGTVYKYELKLSTGLTYMRPDPYAKASEGYPNYNSVVADLGYYWHDREYLEDRSLITSARNRPVSIYELPLPIWKQKLMEEMPGKTITYCDIADAVCAYVSEMGYTHVELTPVMEYTDETTNGYQTTGYFAPTSRYGTPKDFKYLVDTFHRASIGVIMDWTPAGFSPDTYRLACFDGTFLYEHMNPLQGIHPVYGYHLFNFGRKEVRSFLISNAMFWSKEYHLDGLKLDDCSTVLRLDYSRSAGKWIPNLYGSEENLDGIDFLKQLTQVYKSELPEGILIMSENVDWPDVTGPVSEGGLGFDFKWNLHFTEDLITYLSLTRDRKQSDHELLINGMLHHYMNDSVLSFSRGIGFFDRDLFLSKIYGDSDQTKRSILRCAYGYLMMHPGKKLLTTGEDFEIDYLKELLAIYRTCPACWLHDYEECGFEWINTMDSDQGVLTFVRRGEQPEDTLVIVCNFSPEDFPMYRMGVPFSGHYEEITNSDDIKFGGTGKVNSHIRHSDAEACDERTDSMCVRLAPFTVAVFRYTGA